MNQQQMQAALTPAVTFIARWLAISVIVYYGWNKFAPWVDRMLPF